MTISAHEHGRVPELQAGDRLTRDEFERRYRAMWTVKKAELIEGVVYMPSPVSHARHGGPHARAIGWLFNYCAVTPGVECSDNATVRLDELNEPQPDALLRILPARGGSSRTVDGYIEDAPELALEVTASRVSYDLHDKLRAYQRNGVREYIVWRVDDEAIDWFALRDRTYARLESEGDGILRSEAFPGLWLDVHAMLHSDLGAILATLDRGLASEAHADFVAQLGTE